MLILLPPSETKRAGGISGTKLQLDRLGFPELTSTRKTVITALETLSTNQDEAARVLKLGIRQSHEIVHNAKLRSSPTLPALERYTGVLYDALDVANLPDNARIFAHKSVAIASALFGLSYANDPLPTYRLSANSHLPGLTLRKLWAEPIARVLAQNEGVILDLRSQSYVALGPMPLRQNTAYLRVVTAPGGRALNHFNKGGKGTFVRQILLGGIDFTNLDDLLDWSHSRQITLKRGAPGELELVIR